MQPTMPIRILTGDDRLGPSDPVRIINWSELISAVSDEVINDLSEMGNYVIVSTKGDDSTGSLGSVAKPFLTVNAAMAAVTDATEDNQYSLYIDAGTYTLSSPIIWKPFVNIIGSGPRATRIISPASDAINIQSSGIYSMTSCLVVVPAIFSESYCIDIDAGNPTLTLNDCGLVAAPIVAVKTGAIRGNTSNLTITLSEMGYQTSQVGAVPNIDLLDITPTVLTMINTRLSIFSAQSSGNVVLLKDACVGRYLVTTLQVIANMLNPLFSGTLDVIQTNSSTSRNVTSANIFLSGLGSGTGRVFNIGANNGDLEVFSSDMSITNFTTNHIANAGAGSTLRIILSNTVSDSSPFTGAGTIQRVYLSGGELYVNTNIIDENTFLPSSTNNSLQDLFNIGFSAGWVDGGALTDNGDGTVDIASGSGVIRTSNNEQAPLLMFDWATKEDLSLTDNTWNYVVVDYNAGSPIVTAQLTIPNENSIFELYEIYRSGTGLQVEDHKQRSKNTASKIQQWAYSAFGTNLGTDGAQLGETGTRNVTLTSGADLWVKFNNVVTSAFDTSGTDTFKRYYSDGIGGWTEQTGQTQFDNVNYDDLDGTLGAIGVNRYSWQDWYIVQNIEATNNYEVISFYGTSNAVQLADAVNEPRRTNRPEWVNDEHSAYLGRIIVQQGSANAILILQR